MKKSRETFKIYEGEIKNMNARAQDLNQQKRRILNEAEGISKNKKKQAAAAKGGYQERNAQIEQMQKQWAEEKEATMKEKQDLMDRCKEIQDQIKELKQGVTTKT